MFALLLDGVIVNTKPFPYTEMELLDAEMTNYVWDWCEDENRWEPRYPDATTRKATREEWKRALSRKAARRTQEERMYQRYPNYGQDFYDDIPF